MFINIIWVFNQSIEMPNSTEIYRNPLCFVILINNYTIYDQMNMHSYVFMQLGIQFCNIIMIIANRLYALLSSVNCLTINIVLYCLEINIIRFNMI